MKFNLLSDFITTELIGEKRILLRALAQKHKDAPLVDQRYTGDAYNVDCSGGKAFIENLWDDGLPIEILDICEFIKIIDE